MSKLGIIGKASLGVLGAGFGAAGGALIDNSNPTQGAAIGAAVGGVAGALTIPAAIGVGKAGLNLSEKIGSGIIGALSSTATYGETGTAEKMASTFGAFTGGIGAAVGGIASGFGTGSKLAMMASPVQRHLTAVKGFGEKIVKFDTDADALHKVKFTKLGKGIIAGTGLIEGVGKAKNALMESHMGQMDQYVTTATPQIPAYNLNAGATGDLVFALNANRRG